MKTKKWMFVVIAMVLLFSITIAYAGVKMRQYAISVAADATAAQTTVLVSGGTSEPWPNSPMYLYQLKITIPDTTNGVTFTVAILDESSRVVWSQASLADNTGTAPHVYFPGRIVGGDFKLAVTPSGATGNALSVTIDVGFIG